MLAVNSWLGILSRIRNRAPSIAGGDEGSSLLETALVMLLFLSLVIGAIQFSLVFFAFNNVTDAAREAARWAAVRGSMSCTNTPGLTGCNATSAQITSYVQGKGYPGLVASNISVTTTWLLASSSTHASWSTCSGRCNAPGNQVQVQVTYSLPIAIPYWTATSININSTAAMVIAQ